MVDWLLRTALVGTALVRLGEVKPPKPPTLSSSEVIVDGSDISAKLTWKMQPDATEYQITLLETTTGHSPPTQTFDWLTSCTSIGGLKPASEYRVTLKAVGPRGTAETETIICTPPPELGLSVSGITHNSLQLHWATDEPLPSTVSFQVEWRKKPRQSPRQPLRCSRPSIPNRRQVINVMPNISSVSLPSILTSGTKYEVRVRAVSKCGVSKWTYIDAVTASE